MVLCKLLGGGGCYAIEYYYSYLDLNLKSKFCFKSELSLSHCRVVLDTVLGVPMSSMLCVYIVDPDLVSVSIELYTC